MKIISAIKTLFQKRSAEDRLIQSLDPFTDELLGPGPRKIDFVINRAKSFGMVIDSSQALAILQKRLTLEIEKY